MLPTCGVEGESEGGPGNVKEDVSNTSGLVTDSVAAVICCSPKSSSLLASRLDGAGRGGGVRVVAAAWAEGKVGGSGERIGPGCGRGGIGLGG